MSKVLIIGAGGVGGVVAHKAAMEQQAFSEVMLASRRIAPVEKLAAEIEQMHGRDDPDRAGRRRRRARADQADRGRTSPSSSSTSPCPTRTSTSWTRASRPASTTSTPRTTSRPTSRSSSTSGSGPTRSGSRKAGRMALLGSGFDPGVTNVFCAYVAEAPARRDPLRRHRRLQRRLARQGVRHQLQPRDQHPRDHRARPLLGERRVEGDRPAQRVADLRLPGRRRAQAASCSITRSSSRSRRTSRASSASGSG